jgi:hypothetical protein
MSIAINVQNNFKRNTCIFSGDGNVKNQQSNLSPDKVDLNSSLPDKTTPKKWTFLHYAAADNNLISSIYRDVNEMEKVGSTDLMNVISILDKGGNDCKIYNLQKDGNMSKINSPVIKDLGNTNMSDPKVMTNFLVEMITKYPAEHFAFIISDHGLGWRGAVADDTSKDFMSIPKIRQALEEAQKITGVKIDILGFDACLMASGEVATELKNTAEYMVASQESEGASGWAYTPLLSSDTLKRLDTDLRNRLNISPREFAERMIENAKHDQYSIPTLSAFDLKKIDKYEESVNKFSQAILDTETPDNILKELSKKTQNFNQSSSKDQYHFAELITKSSQINDEILKTAAMELMNVISNELIFREQHSKKYTNAHGVTAEIPGFTPIKDQRYKELVFAKETLWEEAVNKFLL